MKPIKLEQSQTQPNISLVDNDETNTQRALRKGRERAERIQKRKQTQQQITSYADIVQMLQAIIDKLQVRGE